MSNNEAHITKEMKACSDGQKREFSGFLKQHIQTKQFPKNVSSTEIYNDHIPMALTSNVKRIMTEEPCLEKEQ